MSGPSEWVQPLGPPVPLKLGGNTITCVETISKASRDPFAPFQPLLYGGSVFQTVPSKAEAPVDLLPDVFEMGLNGRVTEDQLSFLESAAALSAIDPLVGVLPWFHSDRWIIPAAVKTSWVMSRAFSFSLVAYNAGVLYTVPRCWIEKTPNGTESRIELTLVTSGLGAGEFLVDTGADGTSIQTDDLTAYAGRVLCLRYLPKRYLNVAPFELDVPSYNEVNGSIELSEVVPARDYET